MTGRTLVTIMRSVVDIFTDTVGENSSYFDLQYFAFITLPWKCIQMIKSQP